MVLHQVWPWFSPPYTHSAHPEYVTPWNLKGKMHCLPTAGPEAVVHPDLRELVFTDVAVVVVEALVVVVEALVEVVEALVVVVLAVVVVEVVVVGAAVVVVVVVVDETEAVLEAAPSHVLGHTAALPSTCSPPAVISVEHQAWESVISVLAASAHLL